MVNVYRVLPDNTSDGATLAKGNDSILLTVLLKPKDTPSHKIVYPQMVFVPNIRNVFDIFHAI